METTATLIRPFLEHLCTADAPLVVRRHGAGPEWADAALHTAVYDQDPELYALLGISTGVTEGQRMRVLFQVLARSRAGMPDAPRRTLERVTAVLLAALPTDGVLTVFLALRRARANHKHTARAIVRYILDHPALEDLVHHRRPTLAACLEHALGTNTARGALRLWGTAEPAVPAPPPTPLPALLRVARDPARTRTLLPWLYRRGPADGLVAVDGAGYATVHQAYAARLDGPQERPRTVTATNRGDIAATLVHLYRGGPSAELQAALAGYILAETARLPRFAGRLALVLDASASTRSYGEREFCIIAQSEAFAQVLARCCADLRLVSVGGSAGPLPQPDGPTDLASALLDALDGQPDLVVIVSDGYENIYPGDLARVAATLPQIADAPPVVFCYSKFGPADDLTYRCPAPALPTLAFWHQADFAGVLVRLFAQARSEQGLVGLRAFLFQHLEQIEKGGAA